MPSRFAYVLSAFALALVAGPVRAQPAPRSARPAASTVAPVTVPAPAPPKTIRKQSYNYVFGHTGTPNPEIDQISRWRDPVCVQVEGLPGAQAAQIKARIEGVAHAVGMAPAKPSCRANVEIVFSTRPQAVMDKVAQQHEDLLGYYHRHDHDRLKKVTRPVQAWYVTATVGGGGDIAGWLFAPCTKPPCEWNPALKGIQLSREVMDSPDQIAPIGCGDNPHFTACLRSEFRNVFMVADAKALAGKDLGAIADYLVVLALSQPKSLDGCAALSSVIDLLAPAACPGRAAPDGLTPADAAYLTALYASDPEQKKAVQQGDISGRMAKILIKANAEAK